jgi:hypothetical protein
MNFKSLLPILLFSFLSFNIFSQKDSTRGWLRHLFYYDVSTKLLVGVNNLGNGGSDTTAIYPKGWLAEIGIHKTTSSAGMHGPTTLTYGASVLMNLGKDKLYGLRLGVCMSYLLEVGISATYYTDFNKGNLKITPEIGVGISGVKFAVGYNIPTISNKDFDIMKCADAVITINALIKLKTIKHEQWRYK